MPIKIAGLTLYNLDELSKTLKVNKVTLRGYIEQGRLKAVKIGRSYRVAEEDLREFLLKRGRGLGKEEGIELKEIPEGHLGEVKEEALIREIIYEEYIDHKWVMTRCCFCSNPVRQWCRGDNYKKYKTV